MSNGITMRYYLSAGGPRGVKCSESSPLSGSGRVASPGPGPLRRRAAGRGRSRRSGVSAPRNRRIANRIPRSPGHGTDVAVLGGTTTNGMVNGRIEHRRARSPGKRILRKTTQNSNGNECGVRRSTPGPAELQQAPAVARPRPWRSPGTSFSPSQSADSADSHR